MFKKNDDNENCSRAQGWWVNVTEPDQKRREAEGRVTWKRYFFMVLVIGFLELAIAQKLTNKERSFI